MACGILIPWPGIKPMNPTLGGVESQPLDHQENPPNTKVFIAFSTQVMLNSFNFKSFFTPHYLAPMIEMEMNVLGPKH